MLLLSPIFALFLLSASRAYARTKETGRVSVLSTNAALTTNHLPRKANSWLPPSLSKRRNSDQRVHKFPKAKGKVVAEVELSISSDYNIIEIVFDDKTSLTFNLESRVQITPELVSWKSGDTNLSNAGDPFSASNNFSNINTEPAEKRVLSLGSLCCIRENPPCVQASQSDSHKSHT